MEKVVELWIHSFPKSTKIVHEVNENKQHRLVIGTTEGKWGNLDWFVYVTAENGLTYMAGWESGSTNPDCVMCIPSTRTYRVDIEHEHSDDAKETKGNSK